jgi:DNA-binding Lrp family transcriptional regulator
MPMTAYGIVAAYVLIDIQASDPLTVVAAIRQIPGVRQAHVLLGPTDGIAFLECGTHDALRESLLAIRAVPGIFKTDTRYVYH